MEEIRRNAFNQFVVSDRNLERIRAMLLEGMSPDARNSDGNSPLHSAAASRQENINVIRLLIESGADVNLRSSAGFTPLHDAVLFRKREMVSVLLESGADIHARTQSDATALHYAVDNNKPEAIHRLPLDAILEPGLDIVRLLLGCEDIDVDAREFAMDTPLHWAVAARHKSVVKTLLLRGANPNRGNVWGDTPLHLLLNATENHDEFIPIADMLVQYGARLCRLNGYNKTPIDYLIEGIVGVRSLGISKEFIKVVTFHRNISQDVISNIERNAELGSFRLKCISEVSLMRKQVICRQLTMHDYMLDCFIPEQFYGEPPNPCLAISKPLVDILLTGAYSAYLFDILTHLSKQQLWDALAYNVSLIGKKEKFTNLDHFRFLRMCINSGFSKMYRFLSHQQIFNIILAASDLTVDEINALIPIPIEL